MREAKFQLHSTDKSVTQIAEKLNFPNSSFFARFFRKHLGMTPLQFRKS
ncbi:helix-turn-helix domain-containing protein [Coprobacter secundus]|nr:helix-turn-helix domain-containing protein [Coprobacter secundus]